MSVYAHALPNECSSRYRIPMVSWRVPRPTGSIGGPFFCTVFFGSALLFLAMLFAAAAIAGAFILAFAVRPDE
jgi:hypothetical protein